MQHDRLPARPIYKSAFTVGATGATDDAIADYSSLGPVSDNPTEGVIYRKPDIVAPGHQTSARRSAAVDTRVRLAVRHEHGRAARRRPGRADHLGQPGPAPATSTTIEDIIEPDGRAADHDQGCGGDSPTQVPNNVFGWGRIDALAAVQQAVAERPDLRVTGIEVVNNRPREHQATITATVANTGAMAAGASKTEFLIDGTSVLALVDTGPLAPGAARNVSVVWDTKHVANGPHQITVTADRSGQVAERFETNNSSTVTRNVQGNHVRNGSFESGSGSPDGWSGSSTGAGSSSWSEGGSDGAKARRRPATAETRPSSVRPPGRARRSRSHPER